MLNNYNWEEAFMQCSPPNPVMGDSNVSASEFSINDVKNIIAISPGENDGAEWIGLFVLEDGRYVFVSAGCDYTGWDCQASGQGIVSDDLRDIFNLGITEGEKERLQLTGEDINELLSSSLQIGNERERFGMMDFD